MEKSKTLIVWETALNEPQVYWQKVAETMRDHAQTLEDQNSVLVEAILNKLEESMANSPDVKTFIDKCFNSSDLTGKE